MQSNAPGRQGRCNVLRVKIEERGHEIHPTSVVVVIRDGDLAWVDLTRLNCQRHYRVVACAHYLVHIGQQLRLRAVLHVTF